ncbi:hypothetical protein Q670_08530 [Alcanivorax sp. P2S70]|nr:hypothetical protein Q670_08530 [Alcanivorax sp. P2S70]|tara:strand:- start:1319 stop:1432 length:114 start_codon:yes stop_codon:yes gene_type:complete
MLAAPRWIDYNRNNFNLLSAFFNTDFYLFNVMDFVKG